MKLETTITQSVPVPMALMPQLTLPEPPPLLTAPITSIPALSVNETATITPLRQAFFTAPVASDFETKTALVSLPQQFDLVRTHPLLASAATELARLSESAQAVSSFVFARPAVVSGIESTAPIAAVGTNAAVKKILPVPSLNSVATLIENVIQSENATDKTDGGSLIKNVVRVEDASADKTDGGSLIKNASRTEGVVDNTDGGTLIGSSKSSNAATQVVQESSENHDLLMDTSNHDSFTYSSEQSEESPRVPRGSFPALKMIPFPYGGFRAHSERSKESPGAPRGSFPTFRIAGLLSKVRDSLKLMNGALLIKSKDEPLLAKFGPLAPVGPGGPRPPHGRPVIDLRAMILPLEDRKAAAKGESKNQAAAKIDEMSADADSQGGQNQDGESLQ